MYFVLFVSAQYVCALAALTVRKPRLKGKNPIGVADLEWIFACNCEGTEQLLLFKFSAFAIFRVFCSFHYLFITEKRTKKGRPKASS